MEGDEDVNGGACQSIDSRITKLIQQLTCAASETGSAAKARVAAAAAALEAKIYRFETDLMACQAAKRRAEQETAAMKAELTALTRSNLQQRTDWKEALDFARSQAKSRSEDAYRSEREVQRLYNELESLKRENDSCREAAASAERRLRESQNEQRELTQRIEGLEQRATASESQLQAESIAQSELETLRRELRLARDRFAMGAAKEAPRPEEASHQAPWEGKEEVVAHRATLAQECRNLRSEVTRLQSLLLDAETSREQSEQEHNRKLVEADHTIQRLQSKLAAQNEALRMAESTAATLQIEAEKTAESHQAEVIALRERISQEKRETAAVRRRAKDDLAAAGEHWESRLLVAVESAVEQHKRRIQDLELQLTYYTRDKNNDNISLKGSQIPGSFVSSVLDYIPRSEHLRLLQAQAETHKADISSQVSSVRAQRDQLWSSRLQAMTNEMNELKLAMEQLTAENLQIRSDACRTERALALLKNKEAELARTIVEKEEETSKLEESLRTAQSESGKLREKVQEVKEDATCETSKWERKLRDLERSLQEAITDKSSKLKELERVCDRSLELEKKLDHANVRNQSLSETIERLEAGMAEIKCSLLEERQVNAYLSAQLEESTKLRSRLEFELLETKKEVEEAHLEIEKVDIARAAQLQDAQQVSKEEASNLLSSIEVALGTATNCDVQAHTRVRIILSRCRELQTEVQRLSIAMQTAVEDNTSLRTSLAAAAMHQNALQKRYDELKLKHTDRGRSPEIQTIGSKKDDYIQAVYWNVHGSKSASPFTKSAGQETQTTNKANILKPIDSNSAFCQKSVLNRLSTISEEVEAMRQRLQEQAQQTEQVQVTEKNHQELIAQLKRLLSCNGDEENSNTSSCLDKSHIMS